MGMGMTMTKEKLIKILNDRLMFLARAQANWTIWNGLTEAFQPDSEYQKLLEISPGFWTITYNNLLSETLLKTAKVYDEHKGCMGLLKIINICEQNQDFFPTKHEYYLTDSETSKQVSHKRTVDLIATLQEAKTKYESVQLIRTGLITLRDKHLAHADKQYLLDVHTLYQNTSLKKDDIQKLITVAADILNSFLSALDQTVVSMHHTNADDYEKILKYAALGKETRMKELRERALINIIDS
jgi:hypothetical protein